MLSPTGPYARAPKPTRGRRHSVYLGEHDVEASDAVAFTDLMVRCAKAIISAMASSGVLLLAGAAQLHLDLAVGEPALADDHLQRPADKVGISELHASALVAIVDDHLEADARQIARKLLGGGLDQVVARGQRDDAHVSGATDSGHLMPISSLCCSTMAASVRETPTP